MLKALLVQGRMKLPVRIFLVMRLKRNNISVSAQLFLIDAFNLIRRIYAVDSNQSHHSEEHMIKVSCAVHAAKSYVKAM